MTNLKFFIDFDGTITKTDVVDMILERFADEKWKETEKEWTAGKIGSRECLSRQIALVRADKKEFKAFLESVEVDEAFAAFIGKLHEKNVPAYIVSDGFDAVIHEVLRRTFREEPELLLSLPVFCNKLEWTSSGVKAIFPTADPCEHDCANCKVRVISTLASEKDNIIFIGDGLSDRFAAEVSDLTFAKKKLLEFCRENKIVHKNYQSFKDIENWVADNYKYSHPEESEGRRRISSL